MQAVDADAPVWAAAHDATEVDLRGRFLMPAFGDGHAHPLLGGLEDDGPRIREQTSVDGIVAEVGRYAAAHPELDWILGASYDSSLVPDGLFDARWLDAAVPDRPVLLRAWDYHTAWVNSRALELAGITADTPEPVLGELPRRADGSVLGTLREWGAIDLVAGRRPGGTHAPVGSPRWSGPAPATPRSASPGCRTPGWSPSSSTSTSPRPPPTGCRSAFNLALYADPRRWPDQLEVLLAGRERVRALGHPRLTAHTVKFFADGVVENAHRVAARAVRRRAGQRRHAGLVAGAAGRGGRAPSTPPVSSRTSTPSATARCAPAWTPSRPPPATATGPRDRRAGARARAADRPRRPRAVPGPRA